MKSVLLVSPDEKDSTSFYRAAGPFSAMRSSELNVVLCPPEITWATVSMYDVAVMQRPFHPAHLEAAKIIKRQIPLWVDFDDDLFCVPEGNPTFKTYSKQSVRVVMAKVMEMADVVTVSTETIAMRAREYSKNVVVIPNAYNDRWFSTQQVTDPRDRLIVWRGSETHTGDLLAHSDAILKIHDQRPEYRWAFLGFNPWFITQKMRPGQLASPTVDVFEYFATIRSLRASVQIVPLEDNQFNHGKSNIAWIEASCAGTPVVAPNWSEWKRPGVVRYQEPETMADAVLSILDMQGSGGTWARDSWSHIQTNLMLSTINGKRFEILRELTGLKVGNQK